ncbi:putative Carboxylic ester hydrolase [Seiridium cardinale]
MRHFGAFSFLTLASLAIVPIVSLDPVISCGSLEAPSIEDAIVTGIQTNETADYCSVNVYLTHSNSTDNVTVLTWLPVSWNGRYQGTGGGGLSAGGSDTSLRQPVQQGYAASTTDAGLPNSIDGSAWANNSQLIENFAHLSVHQMTEVGKALVEQYYGTPAMYSYWNGCSQGGRQGYMEAQRYPSDYNGIYAASPAINYDTFQVAEVWPYVVQNVAGDWVPQCILATLVQAAIDFCDGDDGAHDGLIADPNACKFDARTWIGRQTNCTGNDTIVTEDHALVFNSTTLGPVDLHGNKLFSGMALGSDLSIVTSNPPSPFMAAWVADFVLQDPTFDFASMDYTTFPEIFNLSVAKYHTLIGTSDPDMSDFEEAGGKLLSWHGFSDPLIGGNGTVQYRESVQDVMGGPDKVNNFYRLFMAPGVGHCGGGVGAVPVDPFDALVAWVENGTVPETLAASGNNLTRNLCPYPLSLRYEGVGDVNDAESWACT